MPSDFRNIEQITAEDQILTTELETLLDAQSSDAGLAPERTEAFRAKVEDFLQHVATAGVWLNYDTDRVAAIGRLSGWVNELYRLGCYRGGVKPPKLQLAPFDGALQPALREEDYPYLAPGEDRDGKMVEGVWDRHVALCRECLQRPTESGVPWIRLVVIAGVAGSGRTSLLRKALAPSFASGQGSDALPPFLSGKDPLQALARHLHEAGLLGGRAPADAAAEWLRNPARLAESWRALPTPRVLLIDRLEEIFTLGARREEQTAFLEALRLLASDTTSQHAVAAVFDSEFLARIKQFDAFFAAAKPGWVNVNLDPNELRRLIVEPARKSGLLFEEGLAEQLVADIQGDPAAVTMVQFTLRQLWRQRARNTITWQAYSELCSGRLALEVAADSALKRFADAVPERAAQRREVVRAIFLNLVRPEVGGGVRIRPFPPALLAQRVLDGWDKQVDGPPPAAADIDAAVQLFSGEQLLTRKPTGEISLAHEALASRWQELVNWLEIERARVRQRAVLRADAEHWDIARKDPAQAKSARDLLYKGTKLAQWDEARAQLRREAADPDDPGYGRITLEFLDASEAHWQREQQLHWLRWGAAAALALIGLIAFFELRNRAHRREARLLEASNMSMFVNRGSTLLAENDPAGALLWFAEARAKEPAAAADLGSKEAHGISLGIALRQLPRLAGFVPTNGVTAADLAPAGDRALLAQRAQDGQPGGVLLWPLDDPTAAPLVLTTGVTATRAVFSHDGTRAALALGEPGENSGALEIWDLTARPPQRLAREELPCALTDIAFSPASAELLAACGTSDGRTRGEVWLCKIADGKLQKTLLPPPEKSGPANCLAFSPDGALLAIGHKIEDKRGLVRVFDVETKKLRETAEDKANPLTPVVRVAFSKDDKGSLLAAATYDPAVDRGDARVYRCERDKAGPLPLVLPPLVHDDGGGVSEVAFSPRDTRVRLLTAGTAGTARIWDLATGRERARLPHDGWTYSIAWSPDGGKVATGSRDRAARLWNANTGELVLPPLDHGGTVTALRFTPDGTHLFATTVRNARLWETEPRERNLLPVPMATNASAAMLSATGRLLAAVPSATGRWGHLLVFQFEAGARLSARLDTDLQAQHLAVREGTAGEPDWIAATTREEVVKGEPAKDLWRLMLWDLPRDSVNPDWRNDKTPVTLGGAVKHVGFLSGAAARVFVVREASAAEKDAVAVVEIFDAATRVPVRSPLPLGFRVHAVAASADGQRLAFGGGETQPRAGRAAWVEVTNEKPMIELSGKIASRTGHALAHEEPVGALAFTPSGEALVTGGVDDAVCVWNLANGQQRWREKHTADVTSVAFSPSGAFVLSTSFDSTGVVRDARDGCVVTVVQHRGTVRSGAFGPRDERYFATAGDDRNTRLWDRVTGDLIAALPHGGDVARVCWDAAQTRLVTSGLRKPLAGSAGSRALEFRQWSVAPAPATLEATEFRALGELLGVRHFEDQQLRLLPHGQLAGLWKDLCDTESRTLSREQVAHFHANEARLAETSGDFASAAWHLRERATLDGGAPEDPELLECEVRIHARVEDWDRTEAAAVRVLRETKSKTVQQAMRETRAEALLRRGTPERPGRERDLEEAVTAYREASTGDPKGSLWHTQRAETLVLLGRFDEAVQALRDAIATSRASSQYQKLAAIHLRQRDRARDPAEAARHTASYEADCTAAFAAFPRLPEAALVAWSAVLGPSAQADLPALRATMEQAVADLPQSFVRLNTLATVLLRQGGAENIALALQRLEQAAEFYERVALERRNPLLPENDQPAGRPSDWALFALVYLERSKGGGLLPLERDLQLQKADKYIAAVRTVLSGQQHDEFSTSRATWNRLELEILLAEYERKR